MANYALRLPQSLMEQVRDAAAREGVSMNQFLVNAAAEKIAELDTKALFRERAQQVALAHAGAIFDAWLAASPDLPPLPGDELRPSTHRPHDARPSLDNADGR